MFTLSDYDYDLPQELIAQEPVAQRDSSRLLHLNRASNEVAHHHFTDLYHFLSPDDVLVLNNTEVIPGRLYGHKTTGGKVEVLLLDYAGGRTERGRFRCQCLVKSSKPLKPGSEILFDPQLKAVVIEGRSGVYTLEYLFQGRFEDLLYRYGKVPLPPYIKRHPDNGAVDDSHAYQTVYASQKGAVAAPTAGLHFTRRLLTQIRSKGVKIIHITLHVSYGTFLPVRVSDIRDHQMHAERYYIPETCADVINHARQKGHRIIAVGTTCVRTLEYAVNSAGRLVAGTGDCDLFIYPGFEFKIVDGLVTNFHLPQSTLLMLVSAFAGRENILAAYREAIKEKYRFYSYGDAMVII